MTNIIDIARMQQMNQPTPQNEPTSTENAQLMFTPDFAAPATIYRFNNAKRGRKVYEAAVKAWVARHSFLRSTGDKKPAPNLFEIKADMFDGWVDLDRVMAINFVEWPKRGKFIPRIV